MGDLVVPPKALPAVPVSQALGRLAELVAGWLVAQRSAHTRRAYRSDIGMWFAWCAHGGVDPLAARRSHADLWARWMESAEVDLDGKPRRPSSPSTVNRRLSAVSSFIDYCADEDVPVTNPVRRASRHRMDPDHSATYRPTAAEVTRMLRLAKAKDVRLFALVTVLVFSGARISEVLNARATDVVWDAGVRVLRVVRKGNTPQNLPLLPRLVADAVDAYLAKRVESPLQPPPPRGGYLFTTSTGHGLSRNQAANEITRLATQAGCQGHVTPHSLRHAFATFSHLAGVGKDDIQHWLGHRDARTTQRYIDRARGYDSHPGNTIADMLGLGETADG